MRIIFSRKGFDSRYGGGASPVLPDGTMVSLPIPESGSGLRYQEISTPRGSMLDLMRELGMKSIREADVTPLDENSEAHLDPDLYRDARLRHEDWRPVFGQSGAAQGLLANQGVRVDDLFLFYGTFRKTQLIAGRLNYFGKPFHALFAYMKVGRIVSLTGITDLPWCAEHPHLVNRNRTNNTLYVSAETLFDGVSRPGSATLTFDERRVLTHPGKTVSIWRLPRFFHPDISGRTLSNHVLKAWTLGEECTVLRTKSPGQEYVVEVTEEMLDWVAAILAG